LHTTEPPSGFSIGPYITSAKSYRAKSARSIFQSWFVKTAQPISRIEPQDEFLKLPRIVIASATAHKTSFYEFNS